MASGIRVQPGQLWHHAGHDVDVVMPQPAGAITWRSQASMLVLKVRGYGLAAAAGCLVWWSSSVPGQGRVAREPYVSHSCVDLVERCYKLVSDVGPMAGDG